MLSIIAYVISGLFFLFVGLGDAVFKLTSLQEIGYAGLAFVIGVLLAGVGPAFTWGRPVA